MRNKSNYKIFYDFISGVNTTDTVEKNGRLYDRISGAFVSSDKTQISNTFYDLYVVNSFELSGEQVIIIKESATGNGGVTYSNGRKQESVPVTGMLYGESVADVQNKMQELITIRDNGEVIEFIGPFTNGLRSNKYFIQNIVFTINEGVSDAVDFTMTLQENRDVNVKTINVNLVNYDASREYTEFWNDLIAAED